MKTGLSTAVGTVIILIGVDHCSAQWQMQASGIPARLRGTCAVSSRVAWASGSQGTVLRTIDGGATWQRRAVPGAERLDFRDVHAVDERTAYILSIGPGSLSRIDKTTDGGATWTPSYRNVEERVFLDATAFWDERHGIAQGDPVDGRFLVLTTDDGGKSWVRRDRTSMPPALPGEGAFAASGTCLVTQGESHAWFATGGAASARVFRSADRGRSWSVAETPIAAGTASAGIFSLAFRDSDHGVAVGGDYRLPDRGGTVVAVTRDGGRSWSVPSGRGPAAFRSAVAYVPGRRTPTLVAVGPTGADVSIDDGQTWKPMGTGGFHALSFAADGAGWAVGEEGRIARFADQLEPHS
jgi:photosystem II stability/assembly factor-like uncharacterized protein